MRMKGYDIYPYATLFASSKDGLQILDALDMWEVDGDPVKVMGGDPLKSRHISDEMLFLGLPSFGGYLICTDVVSVGEDVHCDSAV